MDKLIAHISGIDTLSKNAFEVLTSLSSVEYQVLKTDDDLKKSLNSCDIFWFRLNHNLTRNILKDVRCSYILCAVTGLDHIDVKACEEFGIKIISLKGEKEFLKEVRATAEHTMGLMLALIRKSKSAFSHTESKQWNRYIFQGTELYKKKIGIFGLGRLGKIVAEYAEVFGMEVYYYDILSMNTPKSYTKCLSREELCSAVDILSIHLPYNEQTHFLIDKNLFNVMKPNVKIINTARGGVVNETDLLAFLSNSESGYATDVLYGEPHIEEHPLITYASKNENVIITPHIAGNTFESIEKTENFIASKFKDALLSKI
jgi:D-3-phosphoglycerate dehydrogenase